jgi:hypothetical protein
VSIRREFSRRKRRQISFCRVSALPPPGGNVYVERRRDARGRDRHHGPNASIEDQLTELGLLRLRGDGGRKTNRAILADGSIYFMQPPMTKHPHIPELKEPDTSKDWLPPGAQEGTGRHGRENRP